MLPHIATLPSTRLGCLPHLRLRWFFALRFTPHLRCGWFNTPAVTVRLRLVIWVHAHFAHTTGFCGLVTTTMPATTTAGCCTGSAGYAPFLPFTALHTFTFYFHPVVTHSCRYTARTFRFPTTRIPVPGYIYCTTLHCCYLTFGCFLRSCTLLRFGSCRCTFACVRWLPRFGCHGLRCAVDYGFCTLPRVLRLPLRLRYLRLDCHTHTRGCGLRLPRSRCGWFVCRFTTHTGSFYAVTVVTYHTQFPTHTWFCVATFWFGCTTARFYTFWFTHTLVACGCCSTRTIPLHAHTARWLRITGLHLRMRAPLLHLVTWFCTYGSRCTCRIPCGSRAFLFCAFTRRTLCTYTTRLRSIQFSSTFNTVLLFTHTHLVTVVAWFFLPAVPATPDSGSYRCTTHLVPTTPYSLDLILPLYHFTTHRYHCTYRSSWLTHTYWFPTALQVAFIPLVLPATHTRYAYYGLRTFLPLRYHTRHLPLLPFGYRIWLVALHTLRLVATFGCTVLRLVTVYALRCTCTFAVPARFTCGYVYYGSAARDYAHYHACGYPVPVAAVRLPHRVLVTVLVTVHRFTRWLVVLTTVIRSHAVRVTHHIFAPFAVYLYCGSSTCGSAFGLRTFGSRGYCTHAVLHTFTVAAVTPTFACVPVTHMLRWLYLPFHYTRFTASHHLLRLLPFAGYRYSSWFCTHIRVAVLRTHLRSAHVLTVTRHTRLLPHLRLLLRLFGLRSHIAGWFTRLRTFTVYGYGSLRLGYTHIRFCRCRRVCAWFCYAHACVLTQLFTTYHTPPRYRYGCVYHYRYTLRTRLHATSSPHIHVAILVLTPVLVLPFTAGYTHSYRFVPSVTARYALRAHVHLPHRCTCCRTLRFACRFTWFTPFATAPVLPVSSRSAVHIRLFTRFRVICTPVCVRTHVYIPLVVHTVPRLPVTHAHFTAVGCCYAVVYTHYPAAGYALPRLGYTATCLVRLRIHIYLRILAVHGSQFTCPAVMPGYGWLQFLRSSPLPVLRCTV